MKLDLSSLNLIEKFIVEHGSAAVMGVHISLLREQLATLDREAASLRTENAQLKSTNEDLKLKLQQAQPGGFVRRDGLLWRDGEHFPYCPECATHPVMTPFGSGRGPRLWICPHEHQFPRTA
jgi:hypothetical protein